MRNNELAPYSHAIPEQLLATRTLGKVLQDLKKGYTVNDDGRGVIGIAILSGSGRFYLAGAGIYIRENGENRQFCLVFEALDPWGIKKIRSAHFYRDKLRTYSERGSINNPGSKITLTKPEETNLLHSILIAQVDIDRTKQALERENGTWISDITT